MRMVFIRFNPDAYKIGAIRKRTSLEKRHEALQHKFEEVKTTIETNVAGYPDYYTEIKMFYDQPAYAL